MLSTESRTLEILTVFARGLLPLGALFVSHGVSFVQNYLLGREYASTTTMREMARPYARIVVLHVVIIVAAMPTVLLGSPLVMVLLLIVGKILLDLALHAKSHRGAAAPAPGPSIPPGADGR